MLKITTILKEMRIAQLCSKSERTLYTSAYILVIWNGSMLKSNPKFIRKTLQFQLENGTEIYRDLTHSSAI